MRLTCQRCSKPLHLDASIYGKKNGATEHVKSIISGINRTHTPRKKPVLEVQSRLDALRLPKDVYDALYAWAQDEATQDSALTAPPDELASLFEMFSKDAACGGLDTPMHPLCGACTQQCKEATNSMVQDMEKEIATLTTLEREMARLALVQGDLEFTAQDAARFQRKQDSMLEETHALDSEKERILHKLAKQDDDKASLDAELKALVQEGAALDAKEAQSWDQYNQMAATLQEEMDKHASCAAELTYYQTILAQLDKTSAYKDVFCIEDHGRGMATINGQRLGRIVTNPTASGMRATEQVDWPEINAALGQSAFLLAVLSRILQYKFQTYNIIPRGSFTFVEKLDKSGVVYELYGTSDWQLGRLLHSRRFDYALIGFLECVHELCTHVKQQDTSFEPPYSIRKDRIGDASIRLQFNQPENWTRACKYVLLTYVFFVALTLSLRALLQYALDHIPPAIDR